MKIRKKTARLMGAMIGLLLAASVFGCGGVPGGGAAAGGLAGGGSAVIGPRGEYGDAPEGTATGYPDAHDFAQIGQFPTRFSSNGAHTLDNTQATIGPSSTLEVDVNDPADPDGIPNLGPANTDSDDDFGDFKILLTGIPPVTKMAVDVHAPAGSSGGTFYINVVIDLNMDGKWGGQAALGEPEWVIQNFPVEVIPGDVVTAKPGAFAFTNGYIIPEGAWMRIALTSEGVGSADWDGTGEFNSGEIEDHPISLPDVMGKQPPTLAVDCYGPYDFTGKKQLQNIKCDVMNYRMVGGTFDWTVNWISSSGNGAWINAPHGGKNVGIGPGTVKNPAIVSVPLAANAFIVDRISNDFPSKWRFSASPDPESVINTDGVIAGVGEAYDDMLFVEEQIIQIYLEGCHSCTGDFCEIHGYILVLGEDGMPLADVELTVDLIAPDGSVLEEGVKITTDENGQATYASALTDLIGTFTIEIVDIDSAYNTADGNLPSTDVYVE